MPHKIKVFIVDGAFQYIHHDSTVAEDEPGKHLVQPVGERVNWKNHDNINSMEILFPAGKSPFVSLTEQFMAGPKQTTGTAEPLRQAPPGPGGTNPVFKYKVTVGALVEDPDIVIDLGSGGGPPKKKHVKGKKRAPKKTYVSKKR